MEKHEATQEGEENTSDFGKSLKSGESILYFIKNVEEHEATPEEEESTSGFGKSLKRLQKVLV